MQKYFKKIRVSAKEENSPFFFPYQKPIPGSGEKLSFGAWVGIKK